MIDPEQRAIIERVDARLNSAQHTGHRDRPFVTLTYAQSLDGSITTEPGARTVLSNVHSQTMTHSLRARHAAILVGINTVLADDPRLTVRLVEGTNPRPVILDSRLRFPLEARLLQDECRRPIVATTPAACERKEAQLRAAGAQVIRVAAQDNGRVDLQALLGFLKEAGLRTLMVEGGACTITSFLAAGLADQIILTISPRLIGGLRAIDLLAQPRAGGIPQLGNLQYQQLEDDLIVIADLAQHAAGAGVWALDSEPTDRPSPGGEQRVPGRPTVTDRNDRGHVP